LTINSFVSKTELGNPGGRILLIFCKLSVHSINHTYRNVAIQR